MVFLFFVVQKEPANCRWLFVLFCVFAFIKMLLDYWCISLQKLILCFFDFVVTVDQTIMSVSQSP